ncbi:hypothetical protein RND81_12G083300 [Saponaria officinalis]|uniref:15-cis-phytoene synthase n=1 Tax=Saponaria officinalis TaxID=3572 RepID=A0AAW1H812_SAPOF
MSIALLWVVSPTTEVVYTNFGLTETSLARLVFEGRTRKITCNMRQRKWNSWSLGVEKQKRRVGFPVLSSIVANPTEDTTVVTSEQRVYDVVLKQAALVNRELQPRGDRDLDVKSDFFVPGTLNLLGEAYDRCGEVRAEYAKTFYLETLLMTPEKRRAIWAIYVGCRRTDELVDGPNASHITPTALDRWESRLEDLFSGQPFDMLDAALCHTVAKFPIDIQG